MFVDRDEGSGGKVCGKNVDEESAKTLMEGLRFGQGRSHPEDHDFGCLDERGCGLTGLEVHFAG